MTYDFLDKFTTHLKNVIKDAAQLATEFRHTELRLEHLLCALAKQKGSISTEILLKAGMTPESLKELVAQKNDGAFSGDSFPRRQEPILSESAKKAIEKALSRPFQSRLASVQSLYGMGKASEKIAALIKSSDWAALRTKKFFDLPRANPVLSEAAIS